MSSLCEALTVPVQSLPQSVLSKAEASVFAEAADLGNKIDRAHQQLRTYWELSQHGNLELPYCHDCFSAQPLMGVSISAVMKDLLEQVQGALQRLFVLRTLLQSQAHGHLSSAAALPSNWRLAQENCFLGQVQLQLYGRINDIVSSRGRVSFPPLLQGLMQLDGVRHNDCVPHHTGSWQGTGNHQPAPQPGCIEDVLTGSKSLPQARAAAPHCSQHLIGSQHPSGTMQLPAAKAAQIPGLTFQVQQALPFTVPPPPSAGAFEHAVHVPELPLVLQGDCSAPTSAPAMTQQQGTPVVSTFAQPDSANTHGPASTAAYAANAEDVRRQGSAVPASTTDAQDCNGPLQQLHTYQAHLTVLRGDAATSSEHSNGANTPAALPHSTSPAGQPAQAGPALVPASQQQPLELQDADGPCMFTQRGSQGANEDDFTPGTGAMQQDLMVPDIDERQQGQAAADQHAQAPAPGTTPAMPASQLDHVQRDAVAAALAQEQDALNCPGDQELEPSSPSSPAADAAACAAAYLVLESQKGSTSPRSKQRQLREALALRAAPGLSSLPDSDHAGSKTSQDALQGGPRVIRYEEGGALSQGHRRSQASQDAVAYLHTPAEHADISEPHRQAADSFVSCKLGPQTVLCYAAVDPGQPCLTQRPDAERGQVQTSQGTARKMDGRSPWATPKWHASTSSSDRNSGSGLGPPETSLNGWAAGVTPGLMPASQPAWSFPVDFSQPCAKNSCPTPVTPRFTKR
ncbi:hypothetical protein WJX73_001081 [Symbiochloris irregularis]|uniref:Uncharacterized protein n=1 Tax=Symbiochloris irregularis TaxID=706552 RepID=A0AAW1NN83_9CHLO